SVHQPAVCQGVRGDRARGPAVAAPVGWGRGTVSRQAKTRRGAGPPRGHPPHPGHDAAGVSASLHRRETRSPSGGRTAVGQAGGQRTGDGRRISPCPWSVLARSRSLLPNGASLEKGSVSFLGSPALAASSRPRGPQASKVRLRSVLLLGRRLGTISAGSL